MEWYGNVWCITMDELVRDDRTDADQSEYLAPILTRSNYDTLAKRGKLQVVRPGKGKGNYALIAYDSLTDELKHRFLLKYPNMANQQSKRISALAAHFRAAYVRDLEAKSFYLRELHLMNKSLKKTRVEELAEEYTVNASVIQAVLRLRRDNKLYRKVRGARGASWADMAEAIAFYKDEFGHTLGTSPTRFATWARKYEAEGYEVLITKKFGNNNTLKVDHKTECLLRELASDPHRPFGKTVWQWYCEFLAGKVDFINPVTGELYNPADFPDLSEKTVGDVTEHVLNQAVLSKVHDDRHDYNTSLRPFHKRDKPKYSLSMISMDDKDFTLKISWTQVKEKLVRGERKLVKKQITTSLKAYLAYDVASSAIVGYSFSGEKNRDIFEGCIRNMYHNLLAWGLGQPYEAQVENHLVSLYKESLMREGHLFKAVSFAGAQNSQEKYAEHYNGILKKQFEKYAISEPVGRPHARLAANRTKNRKVSNSANNEYEQNEYSFEDAVAVYVRIIEMYNNAPHPDQKRYKGMTRLEVLLGTVHHRIEPVDMHQLARWAGKAIKTSVVRGKVRAMGEDYFLTPEMLERLTGRNTEVIAYAWQDTEGAPSEEVYLYQEDVFIGVCPRIRAYQVSKLERTEDDMRLLGEQQQRVNAWDKAIAGRMPEGLLKINSETLRAMEIAPVAKIVAPLEGDYEGDTQEFYNTYSDDIASRALADL